MLAAAVGILHRDCSCRPWKHLQLPGELMVGLQLHGLERVGLRAETLRLQRNAPASEGGSARKGGYVKRFAVFKREKRSGFRRWKHEERR